MFHEQQNNSKEIDIVCEYIGEKRRVRMARPVKYLDLVTQIDQLFKPKQRVSYDCAFCDLQMFAELKTQKDLDMVIDLADRCSRRDRQFSRLRVLIFDTEQTPPRGSSLRSLSVLPAAQQRTCQLTQHDRVPSELKAPDSQSAIDSIRMKNLSRTAQKNPDVVGSPFSERKSSQLRQGPTLDLPPDDSLQPGSLPKWMPDGRSRQSTLRTNQLSHSTVNLQYTRSYSPRLSDEMRQLDVKMMSQGDNQQPFVSEGGCFIPEDESSPKVDHPIRTRTSVLLDQTADRQHNTHNTHGQRSSSAEVRLFGERSSTVSSSGRERSSPVFSTGRERSSPVSSSGKERSSPVSSSEFTPSSTLNTTPKNWKRGALLGSGSFGQVFVCYDQDSGRTMAVKQVTICVQSALSRRQVDALRNELRLLEKLQHPRIVRYYGNSEDDVGSMLFVFMEYMSAGSISAQINRYGPLTEAVTSVYTFQIVEGLAYLHRHGVTHRDIKGANVLCDCDGNVKLSDFGAAKQLETISRMNTSTGTWHYMSPEIITARDYTNRTDIWSLGCTVVEMLTGNPPFHELEGIAAIYRIANCKHPLYELPSNVSKLAADFLVRCFVVDPERRCSAEELLSDPFVNDTNRRTILSFNK